MGFSKFQFAISVNSCKENHGKLAGWAFILKQVRSDVLLSCNGPVWKELLPKKLLTGFELQVSAIIVVFGSPSIIFPMQ